MKTFQPYLLCLFLWMLTSCGIELPLPESGVPKKIVLIGELVADDTVMVRGAETVPIKSGPALSPEPVRDLSLTLQTDEQLQFPLVEGFDFLSYYNLTLPFSNSHRIRPSSTYRLLGFHPDMDSVTVEVPVPSPFSARLLSTTETQFNGNAIIEVALKLEDAQIARHLFVIEATVQPINFDTYFNYDGNDYLLDDNRRLYDSLKNAAVELTERTDTVPTGNYNFMLQYTFDLQSENLAGATTSLSFKRIFIKGAGISTGHITRIGLPIKSLRQEDAEGAKIWLAVKSVSPDYYLFLKRADQYDASGYGLTGINYSPVQEGNVKGGLGMVGGVFLQKFEIFYNAVR